MSVEREALAAAIARHGRVARVVVADVQGSTPRETGTAMLIWPEGQSGTIGGGALEWEAIARARAALGRGRDLLERKPLGPGLGQCCGGTVTLLTEIWDAARLAGLAGDVLSRPVPEGPAEMPLAVRRALNLARSQGRAPAPALIGDWMVEPLAAPARDLWIWGAGHVGRALVHTLAPLPDLRLTWIDTAPERFPEVVPDAVTPLVASEPSALVPHAPVRAEHLILTYSHAIDLELCHRLLSHGFGACGLIGSESKWARFRSRLRQLGHADAAIERIACPIGDPGLGKHPHAIAVGVAAALLRATRANETTRTSTA